MATHSNTLAWRIPTDRRAFSPWACKESDTNEQLQFRDLFKKTRDIRGTFHARMSMIKDRNSKDLTKAEEIKKRWKEYTEELYKKRS